MSQPLVSVVSAFYNRGSEVEASVRSLLDQTYTPLEIIIVDDGSKDDTAERLRAFDDPRLSIRIQSNQGFTRSIDQAVRSARGEFVAIHGSGDISLPTRIERQAQVLLAHPSVGVVGCFIKNEGGREIPLRSTDKPERPKSYLELLKTYPISHGEAMFRKSVFLDVGGYRDFFTFAQDHDLWLRMARICKFSTVPESLYLRRRFANAVSADPTKMVLQACMAEFAQQCDRSWLPDKGDLLDRYGHGAAFLRGRSAPLSKRLNLIALKELAEGDKNAAQIIMKANLAQSDSAATRFMGFLADASVRRPWLWNTLLKRVVQKIASERTARKRRKPRLAAP